MLQELLGKRVFLFLNASKTSTRRIEDIVKYHGAQIVNFLQKNVDVIIMDMALLRKTSLLSKVGVTRSQQLLQKSVKKSGSSAIESFSAKWKIPIINHLKVLCCCKTYLHQEEACVGRKKKLRVPFIKVEDRSRQYRPEFLEFNNFPFIDTSVPLPHSPFDTWYKQNAVGNKDVINGKRNQLSFCELCDEEYAALQSHLDTAKHKHAAKDNNRYASVDALIKRGATLEEFVKRRTEKTNAVS